MATDKGQLNKAQEMYCEQGATPTEIADQLGVSVTTVYRWIKKYNWNAFLEDSGTISLSLKLKKEFNSELEKAIEESKLSDPATADKLAKLMKVYEKLAPEAMTLSNILILFQGLVEYVGQCGDDKFLEGFQMHAFDMKDYLRKKYSNKR